MSTIGTTGRSGQKSVLLSTGWYGDIFVNEDEAQTVALNALRYIAEDPDRLDRFMALSGTEPDDLKVRVREPAFLGGVLDYLLGHEPDLLAFAEWAEVDPALPARARLILP